MDLLFQCQPVELMSHLTSVIWGVQLRTPISEVCCICQRGQWTIVCLAQNWHSVNTTDLAYMYISTISISVSHIRGGFFAHFKNKFCTFGSNTISLEDVCFKTISILHICLPSLRKRDCLTHLFIFVSPTNCTFPDTQEPSNSTLNAWTNGVLTGDTTGPGLKRFPWVTWPGVHSHQHFSGWLELNILARFHQTTCTFCTAVRVLQCFINERCSTYSTHNASWLIQPRAGTWLSMRRCGLFQKEQIFLTYWPWHIKEREREESKDDF